jgi:hypothetical protein
MSSSTFWNPEQEPDKSGWDLATEKLRQGRTCPVKVTRTRLLTRISPVRLRIRRGSNMFELRAEHVQQKPLESGQKFGYVWFFWELWF